jgi:PAS domain S-box-containing protein
LTFDTEKKNMARRLALQKLVGGHTFIAAYTNALELAAFSHQLHDEPAVSGYVSYQSGSPVYYSQQEDGEYTPLSKLPDILNAVNPENIPRVHSHEYHLFSGDLIVVDVFPVVRDRPNSPKETIGAVVIVDVIDSEVVERLSKLVGYPISMQTPSGMRGAVLEPLPDIKNISLPDLFTSTGILKTIHTKAFFIGGEEIRISGGERVALLVGVNKKNFVSGIEALRESIFWALVMIAIVILPLCAYFVQKTLTKPIGLLMNGVDALSRNEPGAEIKLSSHDEFGVLAQSFNEMSRTISIREDDLKASRDQLRMITDNLPILILYCDANERYLFVNRVCTEWLALPADKILGRRVKELLGAEYEKAAPYIKRALAGEQVWFEDILSYPDGVNRVARAAYIPHLNPSGAVVGYFSIVEDISEMKRAEDNLRQAQKMETVGQLTGGIAHDFNNLLNIIMGNIELLQLETSGDKKTQKFIDTALGAVERGASLTQRLLSFSRQQILSPQATNISELLIGLEDLIRRTLGETIVLKVIPETNLWPALIDSSQLEHALINLAVNARDAMPEGGALTIEASNVILDEDYTSRHEEVAPGPYVKVSVSDSGVGMTAEVLDKVFEPFFTTKEVGEGSGLGLSMVYGFAKQSRGHVSIYSEPGHGTSVTLYMPRSDEYVSQNAAPGKVAGDSFRGSERILIVEDDESLRKIPVSILRSEGYEVVEAQDGKEAVAHLKDDQKFDLLFTDVVLPGGMNGVKIAEEAERLQPGICVLYTTGYTENAVVHNGQLEEGVTLINKPYRRIELLKAIRSILDSG